MINIDFFMFHYVVRLNSKLQNMENTFFLTIFVKYLIYVNNKKVVIIIIMVHDIKLDENTLNKKTIRKWLRKG